MTLSLVVAAPAADWPTFQAIALSLGYALGNGVSVTKSGVEWRSALDNAATPRLVGILTGQITPPDTEEYTSAQTSDAINQLVVSVNGMPAADWVALTEEDARPNLKGRAHFDKFLADNGLEVIAVDLL